MSIITFLKRIKTIYDNDASLIKSLYYNFKWLPVSQAKQLPMIIGKGTKIYGNGNISLKWEGRNPQIYIGCKALDWLDEKRDSTVLVINGDFMISQKNFIGLGSRLEVAKGGRLIFNKGVNITGMTKLICRNNIEFSEDVLISWDTLFMDSDAHTIVNSEGKINYDGTIRLGNHVWIGAKSTVLKNSVIPDDVVIASSSLVQGNYNESNCIIAGNKAQVVKTGVHWFIEKPCSKS